MANIGLAATIIEEAVISASAKNDLASLILRLLRVDKYRKVTKKLAELMIEPFNTKKTPIKPTSVLPTAVNLVRAENGVIIAQPGNKSFVLRSIEYTKFSSLTNLL
jgi:hypothetical protein